MSQCGDRQVLLRRRRAARPISVGRRIQRQPYSKKIARYDCSYNTVEGEGEGEGKGEGERVREWGEGVR
jgi:hypothetical protein